MDESHNTPEEERQAQGTWPPAPRRPPRVQTAWPPKPRLWGAWQLFLCFLGILAGCVCCFLAIIVSHFGVLLLCVAVAMMLIIGAVVWRISNEAGVGVMIGYMVVGLLYLFVVRVILPRLVE